MAKMNKAIILWTMLLMAGTSFAQGDAALQQAFKESYTSEADGKYAAAVQPLMKVYSEKSYEINLRLGWLYYLQKNYTTSRDHYRKAAGLKPYSVEARLGLAKPLAALESWDELLRTYEESLKIDPQQVTANYWAGVIQYNRKRYEPAARYFERLVNLYPFDYDANHMLGWTYLQLGRTAESRILFQKALLIRPGDASTLSGLSGLK